MKVYLDSKDLIDIFEHSCPYNYQTFVQRLHQGNHTLVLSFANVMELSAPLIAPTSSHLSVTALLNRVEEAPVVFFSSHQITEMELKEAWRAYSANEEYQPIDPFKRRFDYILKGPILNISRYFINFPLSEIVFTLWREEPSLFSNRQNAIRLKDHVSADRSLDKKPSSRQHFPEVIRKRIKSHKIQIPEKEINSLAKWIYDKPKRCPSVRIGYETYHQLVKNLAHFPNSGQIYDFSHVDALPYVNLCTMDRTMIAYVKQAARGLKFTYAAVLCRDASHIMERLRLLEDSKSALTRC